jgi:hypothetical protein
MRLNIFMPLQYTNVVAGTFSVVISEGPKDTVLEAHGVWWEIDEILNASLHQEPCEYSRALVSTEVHTKTF